ncbi:MAG: mechanosensitive ion channel family protein, partial [Reyranellaceae bacterium]
MQRLHWLLLVVLLALARFAMAQVAPPEALWLLPAALALAAAWFVISVLTRLIRNRTLARVAALAIWGYVALVV